MHASSHQRHLNPQDHGVRNGGRDCCSASSTTQKELVEDASGIELAAGFPLPSRFFSVAQIASKMLNKSSVEREAQSKVNKGSLIVDIAQKTQGFPPNGSLNKSHLTTLSEGDHGHALSNQLQAAPSLPCKCQMSNVSCLHARQCPTKRKPKEITEAHELGNPT